MLFLWSIIYLSYIALLLDLNLLTIIINLLTIILNGIILLNILLVISYSLYYLLKNDKFREKFINLIKIIIILIIGIIILCIIMFLFASTAYAESPEPELLQRLIQSFEEQKTNFYNEKELFDTKANGFSTWFNERFDKVEFTKGKATAHFKLMATTPAGNNPIEDHLLKVMPPLGKEIHHEAGSMLDRVSELQALDAEIHSLSQTPFDNTEYQKLTHHFFQFRDSNPSANWYAIKHPNKILTDLDLKNKYF